MDRKRYPVNWEEISLAIRTRAGNKCEQCGVPNGVMIYRDPDNPAIYTIVPERVSTEFVAALWGGKPISEIAKTHKVVLTVHHIGVPKPDGTPGDPHDKMDCRDENLIALCQRCHFVADLPIHIEKSKQARRENRERRRKVAGQILFGEDEE